MTIWLKRYRRVENLDGHGNVTELVESQQPTIFHRSMCTPTTCGAEASAHIFMELWQGCAGRIAEKREYASTG